MRTGINYKPQKTERNYRNYTIKTSGGAHVFQDPQGNKHLTGGDSIKKHYDVLDDNENSLIGQPFAKLKSAKNFIDFYIDVYNSSIDFGTMSNEGTPMSLQFLIWTNDNNLSNV